MKHQSKRFGIFYLTFLLLAGLSGIGFILMLALQNPYYLIPLVVFVIFCIVGLNKKVERWLKNGRK